MTFFSALGLPLIFSPPVGVHERYNRRWALENGPGLKQRDPLHAEFWLREWLNEGTLAAAAFYGFLRMPKFGPYQVIETVTGRCSIRRSCSCALRTRSPARRTPPCSQRV